MGEAIHISEPIWYPGLPPPPDDPLCDGKEETTSGDLLCLITATSFLPRSRWQSPGTMTGTSSSLSFWFSDSALTGSSLREHSPSASPIRSFSSVHGPGGSSSSLQGWTMM
ncbi:hypothetical protein K1719_029309 [Acacia pycnantha]|nr:hypothetical protein K1719_029309 [Acacia pycnantha]